MNKPAISITNDILTLMYKLTDQVVRASDAGKALPPAMVKTARAIQRMSDDLGPAIAKERKRLFG